MPELPEVEIVRQALAPVLVGRAFTRVWARRADLRFPLPERFAERLAGRRVTSLDRRAKYLLARLSDGNVLVVHLGMTGRILVGCDRDTQGPRGSPPPNLRLQHDAIPPPLRGRLGGGEPQTPGPLEPLGEHVNETPIDAKHDHVVFETDSGAVITYNDARRFGFMLLAAESELSGHPAFRGLGPEPLGEAFDAAYLARRARGRTTSLKAFLMDQRTVAGLGNIYVSEALHRAGLSPRRLASNLAGGMGQPTHRAERLVLAIRSVLGDAIAAGGSTLRNYRHVDGEKGRFQDSFFVYGREGEACARPGCRGIVRRIIGGGRSTFFCSTCQR